MAHEQTTKTDGRSGRSLMAWLLAVVVAELAFVAAMLVAGAQRQGAGPAAGISPWGAAIGADGLLAVGGVVLLLTCLRVWAVQRKAMADLAALATGREARSQEAARVGEAGLAAEHAPRSALDTREADGNAKTRRTRGGNDTSKDAAWRGKLGDTHSHCLGIEGAKGPEYVSSRAKNGNGQHIGEAARPDGQKNL